MRAGPWRWWPLLGTLAAATAAALTPLPAGADTAWHATLVRQSPVAVLSDAGTAPVAVSIAVSGATSGLAMTASVFAPVETRSGLLPYLSGAGTNAAPLSTTGSFALQCRHHGVASLTFTLSAGPAPATTTCGGGDSLLDLNCAHSCDGVYPISYELTAGAVSQVIWSLVAVTGAQATPVDVAWVFTSNPVNLGTAEAEADALRSLGRWPHVAMSVAPSYVALDRLAYSGAPEWRGLRAGFVTATSSREHRIVSHPPASTDFATPASHGLLSDVAEQVHLATRLVSLMVSRPAASPVVLGGDVTPSDLAALNAVGARQVVVPDAALSYPTSSTLDWGAPFTVPGAPASTVVAASDTPLRQLSEGPASSAALRATLALGTLSLLHFEAPNAPAGRAVVVDVPLGTLAPSFVNALYAEAERDPLVRAVPLASTLSSSAVGHGYPAERTLANSTVPAWSDANITAEKSLNLGLAGFESSLTGERPAVGIESSMLLAEREMGQSERQRELARATGQLHSQFAKFSIDDTTITLTGAGSPLPVTLVSRASYPTHGWMQMRASGVSFPDGPLIELAIAAPAESIRVPAVVHGSGNFTLDVAYLSQDRHTVIARTAIQVRSSATSLVGYLLTAGSLAVIAMWWWRTARRSKQGQHAT
jgi:hypothetical protein